ncbi:MAG TPA: HD domain-containing protein [Syntrophobacteria bacterium]|nr:HD domain-containing protein [Syntrophobacteria bacterium]
MVPKIEECYALMDEFRMLESIRDHSIMVARVAELIGSSLIKAGVDIGLEKTIAGALLHDIGKTICLQHGGDHAQLGREICLERKLHEVADIVGEHVRLRDFRPEAKVSEKEIVYYADKRVNHSDVVTLAERVRYILDRYGGNDGEVCRRIRANFARCKLVEGKLFARLDYAPKDIGLMLDGRETFVTLLPIGCRPAGRY